MNDCNENWITLKHVGGMRQKIFIKGLISFSYIFSFDINTLFWRWLVFLWFSSINEQGLCIQFLQEHTSFPEVRRRLPLTVIRLVFLHSTEFYFPFQIIFYLPWETLVYVFRKLICKVKRDFNILDWILNVLINRDCWRWYPVNVVWHNTDKITQSWIAFVKTAPTKWLSRINIW